MSAGATSSLLGLRKPTAPSADVRQPVGVSAGTELELRQDGAIRARRQNAAAPAHVSGRGRAAAPDARARDFGQKTSRKPSLVNIGDSGSDSDTAMGHAPHGSAGAMTPAVLPAPPPSDNRGPADAASSAARTTTSTGPAAALTPALTKLSGHKRIRSGQGAAAALGAIVSVATPPDSPIAKPHEKPARGERFVHWPSPGGLARDGSPRAAPVPHDGGGCSTPAAVPQTGRPLNAGAQCELSPGMVAAAAMLCESPPPAAAAVESRSSLSDILCGLLAVDSAPIAASRALSIGGLLAGNPAMKKNASVVGVVVDAKFPAMGSGRDAACTVELLDDSGGTDALDAHASARSRRISLQCFGEHVIQRAARGGGEGSAWGLPAPVRAGDILIVRRARLTEFKGRNPQLLATHEAGGAQVFLVSGAALCAGVRRAAAAAAREGGGAAPLVARPLNLPQVTTLVLSSIYWSHTLAPAAPPTAQAPPVRRPPPTPTEALRALALATWWEDAWCVPASHHSGASARFSQSPALADAVPRLYVSEQYYRSLGALAGAFAHDQAPRHWDVVACVSAVALGEEPALLPHDGAGAGPAAPRPSSLRHVWLWDGSGPGMDPASLSYALQQTRGLAAWAGGGGASTPLAPAAEIHGALRAIAAAHPHLRSLICASTDGPGAATDPPPIRPEVAVCLGRAGAAAVLRFVTLPASHAAALDLRPGTWVRVRNARWGPLNVGGGRGAPVATIEGTAGHSSGVIVLGRAAAQVGPEDDAGGIPGDVAALRSAFADTALQALQVRGGAGVGKRCRCVGGRQAGNKPGADCAALLSPPLCRLSSRLGISMLSLPPLRRTTPPEATLRSHLACCKLPGVSQLSPPHMARRRRPSRA